LIFGLWNYYGRAPSGAPLFVRSGQANRLGLPIRRGIDEIPGMHVKFLPALWFSVSRIVRGLALSFVFIALSGCEEGPKLIYSEKVALLPDASGLLVKEVRSLPQGGTELAILEEVGTAKREILSFPISESDDVKFRSGFGHDTVLLYHTRPDLEKSMKALGKPSFPVRTASMPEAAWMAFGMEEGSPVLYAPDKWRAYLELSRKH
jgi:hypothetical protein